MNKAKNVVLIIMILWAGVALAAPQQGGQYGGSSTQALVAVDGEIFAVAHVAMAWNSETVWVWVNGKQRAKLKLEEIERPLAKIFEFENDRGHVILLKDEDGDIFGNDFEVTVDGFTYMGTFSKKFGF